MHDQPDATAQEQDGTVPDAPPSVGLPAPRPEPRSGADAAAGAGAAAEVQAEAEVGAVTESDTTAGATARDEQEPEREQELASEQPASEQPEPERPEPEQPEQPEPGREPEPEQPHPEPAPPGPHATLPRLSLPSRLVLVLAAVVLVGATGWHLGTVFLSIAPSNPASERFQSEITAHVYPEFEQNWQLFAPNPLQDNIAVEARVRTIGPGGAQAESGWSNLTAQDIAAIRGSLAPSHVDQNLLRRAWDYYTAWHNQADESSLGNGGPLSQEYLKRIALQRLGRDWNGRPVEQIEFRSVSTPVTGPAWTGAPLTAHPAYRTLPWWPVTDDDYAGLL